MAIKKKKVIKAKVAKRVNKKVVRKPVKKAAPKAKKSAKKMLVKVSPKSASALKSKKKDLLSAPDADLKHPAAPVLPWREPLPGETLVGVVDDFLSHITVVTLTLQKSLSVGDKIHVRGHTTDFKQKVASMQVEHKAVQKAGVDAGVGLKVTSKARQGDHVFKIGG